MTWRKFGLGELLIFLYIAIFVRQYCWVFGNNRLAWALSVSTAVLIGIIYLRFQNPLDGKTPAVFWLAVALPLLFIYLLRFPFPDISFDVLNYRLIQAERSLRGTPYMAGDFFPTIFPLNPAPDMLTGIFRYYLGYRLGTIVNYLSLVWAGLILNRLLRPFISNSALRSTAILPILFTEHILFQINTYMVDLLAIPLLLEATLLSINYRQSQHRRRDLIVVALLLGLSTAIKLSNASVVLPLALLFGYEFFSTYRPLNKEAFILVLVGAVIFSLPAIPHAVYIYRQTGSPFFPLYNKIFKSVYWPVINVADGRWGPIGWWETLSWPLISILKSDRLSELRVYSGRLTLGTVAAIVCLFPRFTRAARALAFVLLFGSFLWAMTSGYIRYALYLEVLGGVLIAYLIVQIYFWTEKRSGILKWPAAGIPLGLLVCQCYAAGSYVYLTEWSLRPTYFDQPEAYLAEMRYVLHDHNLSKFLPTDQKPLFYNVETWIVSTVKSSGVQVLLRNDIPMVALHNNEYFDMPESRKRFDRTLNENQGRRMFALSLIDDLDACLANLERHGFQIGEPTRVQIPFYSNYTQLHMALIEVAPSGSPLAKQLKHSLITEATGPLPDDAWTAEISAVSVLTKMRPLQRQTIYLTVKNLSNQVWPARGQKDGRLFINLGDAWLDAGGALVNNMDARSNLPADLLPGETAQVPLSIVAPALPGDYILEFDMVQEGVAWFKTRGSKTLQVRVRVD